jgi:hypothetical protein
VSSLHIKSECQFIQLSSQLLKLDGKVALSKADIRAYLGDPAEISRRIVRSD